MLKGELVRAYISFRCVGCCEEGCTPKENRETGRREWNQVIRVSEGEKKKDRSNQEGDSRKRKKTSFLNVLGSEKRAGCSVN